MSLLDALLLESPKIDVWLAARTDDSIGLGTASEPYNAGVRLDSVQNTITGFAISVTQVTATCVNSYSAGDVVVITGAADSAYNGTFQLLSTNATTFQYVVNRLPTVASGTARVKKVLERRFDSVMNDPTKVGPNVCIHLGPGVFVTAGYYENPVDTGIGWQLKSGMRIVGSGMDVTQVLLTSSASVSTQYYAFGHALVSGGASNPLSSVEICDLTIDCNLPTLSLGAASCAAGAIRLMGDHCRVARVKILNFGPRGAAPPVSFGIALVCGNTNSAAGNSTRPILNSGIEECIALSSLNQASIAGSAIVFHVGGKETPGTDPDATSASEAGFGIGVYVRNCFVDMGQITASDLGKDIRALSMSRCKGGVVERNQVQNVKYGGPIQQTSGAYQITIRNNTFRNIAVGPAWQFSSPNIKKLFIENNTIELIPLSGTDLAGVTTILGSGKSGVWAIYLDDQSATPHPFGEVMIRNNRIRYQDAYLDDHVPVWDQGQGIRLNGCASMILRENILELSVTSASVNHARCDKFLYFENRTPAGSLIQGSDYTTGKIAAELATDADDAYHAGFLLKK